MCRFVLLEVPDITGIPAFTQHSLYGYYTVTHDTLASPLTVQCMLLPHCHSWSGYTFARLGCQNSKSNAV